MVDPPAPAVAEHDRRSLTWPRLVLLLVFFALLPSFVSVFILGSSGGFEFPDAGSVVGHILTASIGATIAVLAVTWLRWWPVVLRESRRTRAWVWLVPGSFLIVAIALADLPRVREAGLLTVLALIGVVLCIAIGEELLFRGVVLEFLRRRHSEVVAAAVSSLLFGLIHFPAGPVQVVASMIFGYLLYLTRRVAGTILVPIVVHAAWDLSVFTSYLTADPGVSNASVGLALLSLVLIIGATAGRRLVDPVPSTSA